jgi:hypothetical protein
MKCIDSECSRLNDCPYSKNDRQYCPGLLLEKQPDYKEMWERLKAESEQYPEAICSFTKSLIAAIEWSYQNETMPE